MIIAGWMAAAAIASPNMLIMVPDPFTKPKYLGEPSRVCL